MLAAAQRGLGLLLLLVTSPSLGLRSPAKFRRISSRSSRLFQTPDDLTSGGLALRNSLKRIEDARQRQGDGKNSPDGFAWRTSASGALVLQSEDVTPWAVLHFVGGFGIAQYPQLCYDALLRRVAINPAFGRGLAVVATPYDATRSLDHDTISKNCMRMLDETLTEGEASFGWRPRGQLAELQFGHSLGGKLLLLNRMREVEAALAAGDLENAKIKALAVTGFNNAPISTSLTFVKDLIRAYSGSDTMGRVPDPVFDILQNVATSLGFDFVPTAQETTLRVVNLLEDYVAAMENGEEGWRQWDAEGQAQKEASSRERAIAAAIQWLPLFLQLDEDELDTSNELIGALPIDMQDVARGYRTLQLEGNHLTPAYLELDIDNEDVRTAASPYSEVFGEDFVRNLASTSFRWSLGDQVGAQRLADTIADWVIREARGVPKLPETITIN
uniref:Uncharacterized protein n=1 Tax=Pinguiococcus pyrenoidosus TaxID=172671 RepID=A0A7R9U574_9STRA